MLGGQIAGIIERIGILEIAGRANLCGYLNKLSVAKRKLYIAFQIERYASGYLRRQLQRELFAIRGENGGVYDATGEQNGFPIRGIELWFPGVAMDYLCGDTGDRQQKTDCGDSQATRPRPIQAENYHGKRS